MTPTRMERFWDKVSPDPVTGCWEWTGAKAGKGYGSFWNGEKLEYAHRFAYRNLVGPIEKPMIDHLCRNIGCCNPAHLEPVTCSENLKRGTPHGGHANAAKTHCAKGHPYAGGNVRVGPDGSRRCLTCGRNYQRQRRARIRRENMSGYWYLASPYSKFPRGLEAAHVMAARAAADLLRAGVNVYSPICHTHPIAMIGGIDPYDHAIWLPADKPFMQAARGLIVLKSEGWEQSYGISEERKAFQQMGKPIAYLEEDFHHRGGEALPAALR